MEHGTHSTQKLGILKLSSPNPLQIIRWCYKLHLFNVANEHPYLEIFVVQSWILIQKFQMFCKFLRTGEVVHMKERVFRSNSLIIFSSSSHHYGKNLEFESIPELFSDVIYTVAVLKRKIEFVFFCYHLPAVRVFSL